MEEQFSNCLHFDSKRDLCDRWQLDFTTLFAIVLCSFKTTRLGVRSGVTGRLDHSKLNVFILFALVGGREMSQLFYFLNIWVTTRYILDLVHKSKLDIYHVDSRSPFRVWCSVLHTGQDAVNWAARHFFSPSKWCTFSYEGKAAFENISNIKRLHCVQVELQAVWLYSLKSNYNKGEMAVYAKKWVCFSKAAETNHRAIGRTPHTTVSL